MPGKLSIRWRIGKRVVARGSLSRTTTGAAALRMRVTRRGERVLRRGARNKLAVRGRFTPAGRRAIRAKRKLVLKAR